MDKDRIADASPIRSKNFSRRSILERAIQAAGAATVLAATTRRAAAKMTKQTVAYQNSPKGNQRCGVCAQFQPPNACQIVEGTINPNGWCRVWQSK